MNIIYAIILLLCAHSCFASQYIENINEGFLLSKKTGIPLLVIFSSPDCIHCNNLSKDLNNGVFGKYIDQYIICKIDVSSDKTISRKYKIRSIPDSRIFNGDKQTDKISGYNREQYQNWIINGNK